MDRNLLEATVDQLVDVAVTLDDEPLLQIEVLKVVRDMVECLEDRILPVEAFRSRLLLAN